MNVSFTVGSNGGSPALDNFNLGFSVEDESELKLVSPVNLLGDVGGITDYDLKVTCTTVGLVIGYRGSGNGVFGAGGKCVIGLAIFLGNCGAGLCGYIKYVDGGFYRFGGLDCPTKPCIG